MIFYQTLALIYKLLGSLAGFGDDFGADPVPGKDADSVDHSFSLLSPPGCTRLRRSRSTESAVHKTYRTCGFCTPWGPCPTPGRSNEKPPTEVDGRRRTPAERRSLGNDDDDEVERHRWDQGPSRNAGMSRRAKVNTLREPCPTIGANRHKPEKTPRIGTSARKSYNEDCLRSADRRGSRGGRLSRATGGGDPDRSAGAPAASPGRARRARADTGDMAGCGARSLGSNRGSRAGVGGGRPHAAVHRRGYRGDERRRRVVRRRSVGGGARHVSACPVLLMSRDYEYP